MRNNLVARTILRHESVFQTIVCRVCCLVLGTVFSPLAAARAGDAAFPGKHPLTQIQAGELLLAERNCAACHAGFASSVVPKRTAPDLVTVGERVSPEFLKRYLISPTTAHPGTTMPDVLAARPESEREAIAVALTHFLFAQSKSISPVEAIDLSERAQGKTLYHSIGCVACHGPRESLVETAAREDRLNGIDEDEAESSRRKQSFQPLALPLGHVAAKYSVQSLGEFLFQPLRARSSGRMPDMKLTRQEALAIADYLIGESPEPFKALVPQPALVSQGEKVFRELNCAACHPLSGIAPAPLVGALTNADLSRGCLSKSNSHSPRFPLEETQIQAIAAALSTTPQVESDEVLIAKTLVAFNCIACHIRDDFGGVHESYNLFFNTSEEKIGDDGRIPPPLTLIGAKLQPAWLKKVLFDGESVRPYMATRMPQYGSANLHHLPEAFARQDVMQGMELEIPNPESRSEKAREREKLLRTAGRELLGDKGVNCIACHKFNGKAAVANQGMDLMTSYQRLQPAWFNSFLRNPGKYRPRIIMPTAWPDDEAAFKTILDGNTDSQIQAIWYYLSLGTSAADPSGIRGISTKLSVGDIAKTHRGRSRVAGFRGIAVGLPEKLNYAFNAETGTLSAIWQGDYISVNWSGQGSGDFNPSSPPMTLAQDVSFATLADENSPWPLMPVMTKEARTNPNPLYPKNVGYQFSGYSLDKDSIPTFMYRIGNIAIEDRSTAISTEAHGQLKRVLNIASPAPQSIWFRALTGSIVKDSESTYRSNNLRLTVPKVETKLRALSDQSDQSELLLKLELPQGKTQLEFTYEPMAK